MTQRRLSKRAVGAVFALLALSPAFSQTDWRRIGNSAIDLGLAGVATGAIDRVWYSEDGSTLYVRTRLGGTFSTDDFETWKTAAVTRAPDALNAAVDQLPESGVNVRLRQAARGRIYAAGRFVYRSEDSGQSWNNLTAFKGQSILGDGVLDLAVSPRESDDVAVASSTGVWRSVDAGLTWSSLNAGLPNLTFNRILATPSGVHGVRIAQFTTAGAANAFEWAPGERSAWRETTDSELAAEIERNVRFSKTLGGTVTASAVSGDTYYAGLEDGRLFSSTNAGASWNPFILAETGRVERIVIDPQDARFALAAVGTRPADFNPQAKGVHVLRTANSGVFWDNLTSNLPEAAAHGIAFERSTGAIYVATDKGIFSTHTDLNSLGQPPSWTATAGAGLPQDVAAVDVRLDPGGNQLYAGLQGLGIYSTTAPHRQASPRVVSAADYSSRAVAPGSVLTLFGSPVRSAATGGVEVPVLASSDLRSEIQIPFNVRGSTLGLAVDSGSGMLQFGLSLESVSPAIFIERDGSPILLDADSGALIDSMTPAHAGGRIQALTTGLGRVNPDWPAGTQAPADNPPAVVAEVHAFLDNREVGVTKSVLAPGYVGFYLVEIQLPSIVNYGPAELVISVDGKESNRVRLYVEP